MDENLRGYVLLLSAHFQGYCRDLYTECSQIIVLRVRPSLQFLVQAQFEAHRKLDRGNANLESLKRDFGRFSFTLNLAADPANTSRLADLALLNRWRNVAAHQAAVPAGLPVLNRPIVQGWMRSCDGLATSLDTIMYNQLRKILRRTPW